MVGPRFPKEMSLEDEAEKAVKEGGDMFKRQLLHEKRKMAHKTGPHTLSWESHQVPRVRWVRLRGNCRDKGKHHLLGFGLRQRL